MATGKPMSASSQHSDVLDYMRGAAILGVLMVHCLALAYGGNLLPWHGWVRDLWA